MLFRSSIDLDIVKISNMVKDPLDYNNSVFVIKAVNVLDMGESEKMHLLLTTLGTGGARYVVVDMKDLEFIDSGGIGVLINTAKLLRSRKGDIVMLNVSARIESIFNPIKLQRFIKIFGSIDECVKNFKIS